MTYRDILEPAYKKHNLEIFHTNICIFLMQKTKIEFYMNI